ncbi:DNA polymerase subunit Cdc27 [Cristinia sonorae]|uniref:DNA polymerase delta subunit 3 n=1 Tax=Cristinia sonorae TaxID=1940300 RepID=A0A8K0UW60_9AGAR|nr:DNA polymerase subunit Cdc27 [Cristinia sonorae]
MSKLTDYLTKQLFIEKNVVTYRSLSRAFSLHANEAKNELASFLETPRPAAEQANATFLISGELNVPRKSNTQDTTTTEGDKMVIDMQEEVAVGEVDVEETGGDVIPQTTMLLVPQRDLDNARAKFSRIFAVHIYSLSPSPLHDAGLICSVLPQIYEADAKLSSDASTLLGRIVGPHVHVGKVIAGKVASSSKVAAPSKPALKKEASSVSEPKPKPKETVSESMKKEVKEDPLPPAAKPLKPSGKLDWSKAKAKGANESKLKVNEEKGEAKMEAMEVDLVEDTKKLSVTKENETGKTFTAKTSKAESSTAAQPAEKPKRGTKRKTALQLDSDSEPGSKPSPKPVAKLPSRITTRKSDTEGGSDDDVTSRQSTPPAPVRPKGKKAILSDDEEDDVPVAKSKGKRKIAAKKQDDVPQSLKAMFDVDDDEVIQGSSRPTTKIPAKEPSTPPEETPDPVIEVANEDVEMSVEDDTPVPKVPPKKRKEKKVIPVGKNGLKKKRVVKQKTFMDDSGYMVTEDYSEYESVDEEEPEAPKARKGAKAKKTADTPDEPQAAKQSLKAPRRAPSKSSESSAPKKAPPKLTAKGSIQNFFAKK